MLDCISEIRFTLHSATIKTISTNYKLELKEEFTLHSATIKTGCTPSSLFKLLYLHYTLLLLKLEEAERKKQQELDLHYTLLLLKQFTACYSAFNTQIYITLCYY